MAALPVRHGAGTRPRLHRLGGCARRSPETRRRRAAGRRQRAHVADGASPTRILDGGSEEEASGAAPAPGATPTGAPRASSGTL